MLYALKGASTMTREQYPMVSSRRIAGLSIQESNKISQIIEKVTRMTIKKTYPKEYVIMSCQDRSLCNNVENTVISFSINEEVVHTIDFEILRNKDGIITSIKAYQDDDEIAKKIAKIVLKSI